MTESDKLLPKFEVNKWTDFFYKIHDNQPPYFDIWEETRYIPTPSPHNDKSVLICDIHAPYQYDEMLQSISNIECDNLIIAGDWFDFLSMSRFPKRFKPSVDFKEEFRKAFRTLIQLCQKFPQVYFMMTNHDSRFRKYLFDNVKPELANYVQDTLIEDLLGVIPNLKIVSQKNGRNINYAWQYRDIVFTHIEKSSVQNSKILNDIEQHLHKWEKTYKLKEYNCIIQAHNHRFAYDIIAGKHCYLAPCLINIDEKAFDYVFDGKAKGEPPVIGYMVIGWTDNKFDYSKTDVILK